jgi:hypothetical protein
MSDGRDAGLENARALPTSQFWKLHESFRRLVLPDLDRRELGMS